MNLSPPVVPPANRFANAHVLVQSWYATGRSGQFKRGQVRTVELGRHRIAIWRDNLGEAHAIDAICPHLGADLGQAKVTDDGLRCVFHHWKFDDRGQCVSAPGHASPPHRCSRVYPVRESFGLIWVFAGDTPTHDPPAVPMPPPQQTWWRWYPPSQVIRCHPHLVIGNGLDAGHFAALHAMDMAEPPRLEHDSPRTLTLHLRGRPRSSLLQHISGTRRADIVSRFTTDGPSAAMASVDSPVPFHTLFTARPTASGNSITQVVLLVPRGLLKPLRCLAAMYALLHNDRQVLERLRFHRGFTEADEPLRRFAELIDGMEVLP